MSQIKLTADSGGGTTSLKAPSSTTSNADVVLKLPVADGSSGQVLKTDGSGQLSFTSNAGTTINNNADNRVITGSGTANTLNGESNVIIDSNGNLGVGGAPDFEFQVTDSSGAAVIRARDGANAVTTDLISDSTGGHIRTVTNHSLRFSTNQSERMRIDSSGKVGIGTSSPSHKLHVEDSVSNVIVAKQTTNNGGYNTFTGVDSFGNVKFYATHNGRVGAADGIIFGSDTAAANALDDYEEGSWTPTFNTGSASSAMFDSCTYNDTAGFYTKIGNRVMFEFRIQSPSQTNPNNSSHYIITGLPFTSSSDTGSQGGAEFNYSQAVCATNNGYLPTMHIGASNTNISFYTCNGNVYSVGDNNNNFTHTLHVHGQYTTAS